MGIVTKAAKARSHVRASRPWRAVFTISAQSVLVVDCNGQTLMERQPDLLVHGRSTIKMLTAVVARHWVTLTDQLIIAPEDFSPHSVVAPGDALTVADAIRASLIYSDATATMALCRLAGTAMPGAGEPLERFVAAMQSEAHHGWIVTDPRGFGCHNRVTARGMVCLLRRISREDPWLHEVLGTDHHELRISGSRVATFGINRASIPYAPVVVAAKGGTHGDDPTSDANLVWSWRAPNGEALTAAVMGTDKRNRPLDIAAVQCVAGGVK